MSDTRKAVFIVLLLPLAIATCAPPAATPRDRADAGEDCPSECVLATSLDGHQACVCEEPSCVVDDVAYAPGDVIREEGCEVCVCDDEGLVSCDVVDDCVLGCSVAGMAHPIGATFDAEDACNTCLCEADGVVSCTSADCQCDPASEDGCATDSLCLLDDKYYAVGTQRPAPDGCNTCYCGDDGQWGCTEVDCSCLDENDNGVCDDEESECTLECDAGRKADLYGREYCECLSPDPCTGDDPASFGDGVSDACVPFATSCHAPAGWAPCTPNPCEAPLTCDEPAPTCADGFVPGKEDGCWGECVAAEECFG